jgi:NADP-dependent 3-hydroxy acid dehydrogenase YdfG
MPSQSTNSFGGASTPPARGVVVITGANSGLGAEMARQFATLGYDLGLCALRTERLAVLADEIHTTTGRLVQTSSLDVTDPEAVKAVFHGFADVFGSIDRIVVNAGISGGSAIGTGNAHANYNIAQTNFVGALAQCEAALEIFRDQHRGHLVLISSMVGLRGFRGERAVYAATKAGVASLGEGLRSERIPGVDISVLYPGLIRSEISTHVPPWPYAAVARPGTEAATNRNDQRLHHRLHGCIGRRRWAHQTSQKRR